MTEHSTRMDPIHHRIKNKNARRLHGCTTGTVVRALAMCLALLLHDGSSWQAASFSFQSSSSSLTRYSRPTRSTSRSFRALYATKGFGAASPKANKDKKKKRNDNKKNRLSSALNDDEFMNKRNKKSQNTPYVKSDLEALQAKAATSVLGRAVATGPLHGTPDADPFWELMPSLIQSRFPKTKDSELERVAGFLRHALNPDSSNSELASDTGFTEEDGIRPRQHIHAYMPNLGATQPFHDASQLEFCRQLADNYETILEEYHALVADVENGGMDRFQSVTSMNYDSGWKTLVLFYNGHRIEGFPYHLCPTTTRLLETMPLAGRIAGFNRQQPLTGIPRHTDGNNMWLTTQMGLKIPDGQAARITVAEETQRWNAGECLLYDTTYWHETFNEHESQERVVLHVDFFNTLSMTPLEIEILQYIYSLREQFMKAEGVSKVGAQIL